MKSSKTKIAIIMAQSQNRKLLAQIISKDYNVKVIKSLPPQLHSFDIYLMDTPNIMSFSQILTENKATLAKIIYIKRADDPKPALKIWDIVDDILTAPLEKNYLLKKIETFSKACEMEKETKQLYTELKKRKKAAEMANVAKSAFLAHMSHEIRSPLGVIIGFTELLQSNGILDSEKNHYLSIINKNSEQLIRLVDDILDLSKVEAGKISIEENNFSIKDMLINFHDGIKIKVKEKNVNFEILVGSKVPDFVISDITRIRQILMNIVGNAIKFTESGTISLIINYDDGKYSFKVSDTGIGMDKDQSDSIFSDYVQADSSTTRKYGGTGLGLVLTKKLCKALGGDLILESSQPNEGSTFVATINIKLAKDTNWFTQESLDLYPVQSKKINLDNSIMLNNMKILLVDDTRENQLLVKIYLEGTNALLSTASNGNEGFNKAIANNFDLILMDIQMPILDGYGAMRKLKDLGYTKPIVALTANAMKQERETALSSGFNGYITKPLDRTQLLDCLYQYHHMA